MAGCRRRRRRRRRRRAGGQESSAKHQPCISFYSWLLLLNIITTQSPP
jgi:hypothetical protein